MFSSPLGSPRLPHPRHNAPQIPALGWKHFQRLAGLNKSEVWCKRAFDSVGPQNRTQDRESARPRSNQSSVSLPQVELQRGAERRRTAAPRPPPAGAELVRRERTRRVCAPGASEELARSMASPIRLQRTDIGMSLTQLMSTEPPSGYTWHFGAQEARVGNAVLPLPAWETSLKRSDPSLERRTSSLPLRGRGRTGRKEVRVKNHDRVPRMGRKENSVCLHCFPRVASLAQTRGERHLNVSH